LKVVVAAVGPELQSAAAVEFAAFLVVGTEIQKHTSFFEQFQFIPLPTRNVILLTIISQNADQVLRLIPDNKDDQ